MKLHLLHGPGKTGSRQKLIEIKEKFDPSNIVVFEEGSSSKDIADNLVSTSLFSDERLVVLENPPEDFTNYTLYPIPYVPEGKESSAYTLILWFDREVSEKKPIIAWVKKNNGQILYFPESKEISVFPFLDYLGNRDKRAFLEMDNLKKAGYDSQYLITMIFYLLRNLIYTPTIAKDFVKNKNARMRTNFSQEELVDLYKFILETDFKIKSGLIDETQAEFMLVKAFTMVG